MSQRESTECEFSLCLGLLWRYLDLHCHLPLSRAFVSAADRRHVRVITADSYFDVGLIRNSIVGRIEAVPADCRDEDLRPGMCGTGAFGGQVTAHVKRRDAQRAAKAQHHVREVLANTATLRKDFAHVR